MPLKEIFQPRKSAKDAKGNHFLRLLRFLAAIDGLSLIFGLFLIRASDLFCPSAFGLRISFEFRPSGFGFAAWPAFRFAD
jgi:hypothetical protein